MTSKCERCDRFTAVTRPISYARQKTSRRVYVMIAAPWVVSLAISSPIALGLNQTARRADTPRLCTFYNSDFLIYSSMGSFYIPCIIMICLYSRIFFAIRAHARKATTTVAARKRAVASTTVAKDFKEANDKPPAPPAGQNKPETVSKHRGGNTVIAVDMVGGPHNDVTVSATVAAGDGAPRNTDDPGSAPRTPTGAADPAIWTRRDGLLAPPGIVAETEITATALEAGQRGSDASIRRTSSSPTWSLISRFRLSARRRISSDKRGPERSSSRRERKATKTLAIVLGLYQHRRAGNFF